MIAVVMRDCWMAGVNGARAVRTPSEASTTQHPHVQTGQMTDKVSPFPEVPASRLKFTENNGSGPKPRWLEPKTAILVRANDTTGPSANPDDTRPMNYRYF